MNRGLPAPNLALIGFMASGKTSVGRVLSTMTGLPFLDVDALVESHEGMSVAEIFATHGETRFRLLEGAMFRRVCEGHGQIIGCGGGTLIDPLNRAALRSRCYAVWLRTSAEQIVRRVDQPDAPVRPLVEGKDLRIVVPELLQLREEFYRGADMVLETDRLDVETIAAEICLRLGIQGKAAP